MLAPQTTRKRGHKLPLIERDAGTVVTPAGGAQTIRPRSVRLSLTDRCDFACVYCRPSRDDGYVDGKLAADDWRTIVDGLVAAGVRRFRITGGEPLLVGHVVDVVRYISERGIDDLALTTNASRLEVLARPLRDAGLMRVNVSIDTLDAARFAHMTRGGKLATVLRGIEAARQAGFDPIKLNTVVLRGVNDDELEPLVRFAHERGLVPRFLEVMPIGEGAKLAAEHLVTVAEMRALLGPVLSDQAAVPEPDRGPARYVSLAGDPAFRVGFISGSSDTYCGTCDRLRVSSTGTLRPCLATDDGVEAGGAPATEFQKKLDEAWTLKPDGRVFKGCTEPSARSVNMRAIGG